MIDLLLHTHITYLRHYNITTLLQYDYYCTAQSLFQEAKTNTAGIVNNAICLYRCLNNNCGTDISTLFSVIYMICIKKNLGTQQCLHFT